MKRIYMTPSITMVNLNAQTILATSDLKTDTAPGRTGGDAKGMNADFWEDD